MFNSTDKKVRPHSSRKDEIYPRERQERPQPHRYTPEATLGQLHPLPRKKLTRPQREDRRWSVLWSLIELISARGCLSRLQLLMY